MTILAIESSCDDTAAAVICDGRVESSIVSSQLAHVEFGGVVPEVASRAHQRSIVPVVDEALSAANRTLGDIDAIGVTYGPGLAGSLLVGLTFAKGLALALDVPIVGINHLEGHLFSVYSDGVRPPKPSLSLIVSGGHTELVRTDANLVHTVIGRSRDDAAGEALDKFGKLLGLDFPAGPIVDKLAESGDPRFHRFPRARLDGFDFSFSGIKTSVLYHLNTFDADARAAYVREHANDLCASFLDAVIDMLEFQLLRALDASRHTASKNPASKNPASKDPANKDPAYKAPASVNPTTPNTETEYASVAVVGGVSANRRLRSRIETLCRNRQIDLYIPDPRYRTDNAAMIGLAAYHKLEAGLSDPLTLTIDPSARLQ